MNTARFKVLVSAGLGNQLFQYSFAHYLQSKFNQIVTLENKIAISNNTGRRFELNYLVQGCTHLYLKSHKVLSHETKVGRLLYKSGLAIKYESRVLGRNRTNCIIEKNISKDLSLALEEGRYLGENNLIFDGYWQKWEYVFANSGVIFSELTNYLNSQVSTHHSINSLTKPLLVVHVRRGDYLSTRLKGIIGLVDIDSYISQIQRIKNIDKNITTITLTDSTDHSYFKNQANLFGTILDSQSTTNWEALKIMSRANYLITANSTFSWWGAFLSAEKGGEVFIPSKWFLSESETFVNNYKYPKFNVFDARITN